MAGFLAEDGAPLARALREAHALHRHGDLDGAELLYEHVLRQAPEHAETLHLSGVLEFQRGRPWRAIRLLERAIERERAEPEYQANLALMLLATGQTRAAARVYRRVWLLRRLERPAEPGLETFACTSRSKLEHDAAQLRHLARGYGDRRWDDLARSYEAALAAIPWQIHGHRVALPETWRRRLADTYNRVTHLWDARVPSAGVLRPDLDGEAITRAWHERSGLVWFDGLLGAEALASLRRFCLESTIWHDFSHDGYLVATLEDGFACDLLARLVDELRERLPGVIGDLPLNQLWAFKYDARARGTGLHADFAAVNLNFWITPDDANLDPDAGGLVVYEAEAPREWGFETYNREAEQLRAFLAQRQPRRNVIPYRENRAVLFRSGLLHGTDRAPFRDDYESRRINVTLLFGDRRTRP